MEEKIVQRLQKLLNITKERGASEAEANMALESAQRLMREHNISMATLNAGTHNRQRREAKGRAQYKWQNELFTTVARVNFCRLFIVQTHSRGVTRSTGYQIIGRPDNVASALVMFDYLTQAVNHLVLEYVHFDNSKRMSSQAVDFQKGCGQRLRERLHERHEQWLRQQADEAMAANDRNRGSSTALVVIMTDYQQDEDDKNNDFINGWAPGTTRDQRERRNAEVAEREHKRAEDKARYMAEGFNEQMADYLSRGYSVDEAIQACQPPKEETPAQRRKREERDRRWYERYQAKLAKQNTQGYRDGLRAAMDINLDQQIDDNFQPNAARIK